VEKAYMMIDAKENIYKVTWILGMSDCKWLAAAAPIVQLASGLSNKAGIRIGTSGL
jgi:hypothetical protein